MLHDSESIVAAPVSTRTNPGRWHFAEFSGRDCIRIVNDSYNQKSSSTELDSITFFAAAERFAAEAILPFLLLFFFRLLGGSGFAPLSLVAFELATSSSAATRAALDT